MWALLSDLWHFMQEWTGYFALMSFIVLICVPFESAYPRLAPRHRPVRRTVAIAVMALSVMVMVQLYSRWGQQPIIDSFVKLKIFRLSKLPIPDWLLIVISILLLDFVYYLAHLISHHVKILWQVHKIHHADEHVTAFSSLLHHPFESLYIALFVTGFAVMLGVPVLVYLYYGIALAVHAVFSHADIALPEAVDRKLRWVIVTPDVHRTHHSQNMAEGNSNFGAMFTLWDRLFGTYRDAPAEPLSRLRMGLPAPGRPVAFTARELLLFPFRR